MGMPIYKDDLDKFEANLLKKLDEKFEPLGEMVDKIDRITKFRGTVYNKKVDKDAGK